MDKRIQKLLASSSSVEKLEREHVVHYKITHDFNQIRVEEDTFYISFYPHRQPIKIGEITTILDPAVYSMGMSPRYLPGENIMFFANQEHRQQFLLHMLYKSELDAWTGTWQEWKDSDQYGQHRSEWQEWINNNLLPTEPEEVETEPLPETVEVTLPTIEPAQLPPAYAIAAYALMEGANSHLGL